MKLATESEALGAMSRTGGRPEGKLPGGSAPTKRQVITVTAEDMK